MKSQVCYLFLIAFSLTTCGKGRRPELSDAELFALQSLDTSQKSEPEPDMGFSDMDIYIVPPPSATTTSSKSRFIPKSMSIARYTQFGFADDYFVAGNHVFGLHCYDTKGEFLYTIESNDAENDINGFSGRITTCRNFCLYNVIEAQSEWLCLYDLSSKKRIMTRPFEGGAYILDDKSMAGFIYDRSPILLNNSQGDFMLTFGMKGDTLCRFPNYNPAPVMKGNVPSPPDPDIYYHKGHLTFRQIFNDTVYRVVSPNRLLPAYILNFGVGRTDEQTYFAENLSGKLIPYRWLEADKYILFVYTRDRVNYFNLQDGSIRFFYAYYDKQSQQIYHADEGSATPPDRFLIENTISGALPFTLSYVEIADNRLTVAFNKDRLDEISKHKSFASLSGEQQQQLKTFRNELADNELLIMILE